MPLLPFFETLHVLSNSSDLRKGEVCIHSDYFLKRIRSTLSPDSAVQDLDLQFRKQHLVVSARVGKGGMYYSWANTFALRKANLNGAVKHFSLEPSTELRVKPESNGAKVARFLPSVAGLVVPALPMLFGTFCKSLIDKVTEDLVSRSVDSTLENSRFSRAEGLWSYQFTAEDMGGHLAFSEVSIPGVGKGALFGDVIIARSVHLKDDRMKVQLGLNPIVVNIAHRTLPTVPDGMTRLPVVNFSSIKEAFDVEKITGDMRFKLPDIKRSLPGGFGEVKNMFSSGDQEAADEEEEVNDRTSERKNLLAQTVRHLGKAKKKIKGKVKKKNLWFSKDANEEAAEAEDASEEVEIPKETGEEEFFSQKQAPDVSPDSESAELAEPEQIVDAEWAEELQTMSVRGPEDLVDGFSGFDLVDIDFDLI